MRVRPMVRQCKHARYKAARRNWKVQYAGREFIYENRTYALYAAGVLYAVGRVPAVGLLGVQKIN